MDGDAEKARLRQSTTSKIQTQQPKKKKKKEKYKKKRKIANEILANTCAAFPFHFSRRYFASINACSR